MVRHHVDYARLMHFWEDLLGSPTDFTGDGSFGTCSGSMLLALHYEAVVLEFDSAAATLFEHVQLPWTVEAARKFYKRPGLTALEGQCVVRTASAVQVREPLYHQAVGKWQKFAPELEPFVSKMPKSALLSREVREQAAQTNVYMSRT